MSRVTIKLLGEMVNSFVFFIYTFISSDFEQKSLTNERIYDMINDYKKELKMHSEIGARQLRQFIMVKQDKPAHLAYRTQNLFHLGRPQNQPHNDMTAFF